MSKAYHILYKTTNLINGKYYIGIHSTNDLNDGYIGSGYLLWKSIDKHGLNNFKCENLKIFKSREKLLRAERIWVNQKFIELDNNYNMVVGGSNPPVLVKHSEETKRKISKSKSNPSIETRTRMSKAQTGISCSNKAKSLMKKEQSRPWLNRAIIGKPHLLQRYIRLDEGYDIYSKYNLDIKGAKTKFWNEYYDTIGLEYTNGVHNYYEKFGDPRLDSLWIEFKERI